MVALAPSTTRSRTFTWEDAAAAAERARPLPGKQWLEAIRDGLVAPPPAAAMVGMTLSRVDDEEVVFSIEPAEYQYNPGGTVHGGVITLLADTAMTTSIIARLPAGSWAPTIELKVNFIRPITAATGRVHAVGRVIHVGATTGLAEAHVVDADGKLYAHATSTCAIRRGDA